MNLKGGKRGGGGNGRRSGNSAHASASVSVSVNANANAYAGNRGQSRPQGGNRKPARVGGGS